MGKRGRRRARDVKYAMGVDLAADGSVDSTVLVRWEDGIYYVENLTIEETCVETREDHPLDAGGSEP